MNTHIVRIIVLIGLSLGLLLAPAYGQASDNKKKKMSIAIDGETIADLDFTISEELDGRYLTINSGSLNRKTVKGSGKLVKRTLPAPAFHKLSAARGVAVVIGGTNQIEIKADDNLIDYVVAEASNGTLTVKISDKIKSISNSHVTVRIPNNGKLDAIRASSGASVRPEQALKATRMEIDLSSAASLDLALKADYCSIALSSGATMKCVAEMGECDINASSSSKLTASVQSRSIDVDLSSGAKVTLSGSCKKLEADLSSASRLDASQLEVSGTVEAEASSGADVSVNCSGSLVARASSGADIDYTGDCSADVRTSSGGSVKKR